VVRNGARQQIAATGLVPGDVVVLQEGYQVPADLRLFEAQSLQILEAQLTGEPDPIKKVTKPLLEKGLKGKFMCVCCLLFGVVIGGEHWLLVSVRSLTRCRQRVIR
jgi:P-type E1-E2 ATPase